MTNQEERCMESIMPEMETVMMNRDSRPAKGLEL